MRSLLRDPVGRVILLLALLVRLGFFLEVKAHDLDLSTNTTLDMIFLEHNARRVADGDVLLRDQFLGSYSDVRNFSYGPETFDRLFGKNSYFDSPGFVYFGGLCETIGPRSPYSIVFGHVLLETLTCAMVYALARRLRGLAAARLALFSCALCFECVSEGGFILRETLLATLATANALALLEASQRRTARGWFVAGLLFGAGWMTKLSFTLLLPAGPLMAWLASADPTTTPGVHERARRTARDSAVYFLGAAVVIAPFAARNVYLGVPPLRMSVLPLVNAVYRNAPKYDGAAEGPRKVDTHAILKDSDGSLLSALVATVKAHDRPQDFFILCAHKFAYFWLDVDFWNNIRGSWLRVLSPWLKLSFVTWGVLAPWTALGILGALLRVERRRTYLPLVLVFVTLGLGVAIVAGVYTRYRMIVEPISCVFFATTIVDIAEAIRRQRRVVPAVVLAVGVGLHGLFHIPLPPLTKPVLWSYVVTTWTSPRALQYLTDRIQRSNAPDQ